VIGEVDHWWWLGFRAKVWRPSLVRAGLLGKIVEVGPRKVMAHWHDGEGRECSKRRCCMGASPRAGRLG